MLQDDDNDDSENCDLTSSRPSRRNACDYVKIGLDFCNAYNAEKVTDVLVGGTYVAKYDKSQSETVKSVERRGNSSNLRYLSPHL